MKSKVFNPFYEFVIDKTRKNNIFVSFLRWWKLDWIGWSPEVARSLYFIYCRKLSSEYLLENKACLKKTSSNVFVSQINWSIKLLLCSAKSFRQRWAMWRQLSKRFFSNFSFVKILCSCWNSTLKNATLRDEMETVFFHLFIDFVKTIYIIDKYFILY